MNKLKHTRPYISFVVPLYNEAVGCELFHEALQEQLKQIKTISYEIIYCDDGSTDSTNKKLHAIARHDVTVRIVALTRNFGKEIAVTAGLIQARGDAAMTLDADGQHPVELIPDFIDHWRAGSRLVVGVRTENHKEGIIKRQGSSLFYGLFCRILGVRLRPGLSDFRLVDRSVLRDFLRLQERNRITRGLVEWLGYECTYVPFAAKARMHGVPGYSFSKLFKLAVDSAVSLSISPLYITAYIGAAVLPLSVLIGLLMVINFAVGDPFSLHITGGAYVVVMLLFLMGILMVSQGIIGLYLSHIHAETQNRPLFILDTKKSQGLHED